MLSVRFRLNPGNSNSHGFKLHRPSIKGTKLLLTVMKASKVSVSLAVKLVCDDDHCFHTDFTTKLVLDSKSKVGVSLAESCLKTGV